MQLHRMNLIQFGGTIVVFMPSSNHRDESCRLLFFNRFLKPLQQAAAISLQAETFTTSGVRSRFIPQFWEQLALNLNGNPDTFLPHASGKPTPKTSA
jgi:hypothetical protein